MSTPQQLTGLCPNTCPSPHCAHAQARAKRATSAGAASSAFGAGGGGCAWTGKLADREAHLSSDCGFQEVACDVVGCSTSVQRQHLAEHRASCPLRLVPCEFCQSKVAHRAIKKHTEQCDMAEVACPQKCGAQVKRGEKDAHKETCPHAVVKCPFKPHGCKATIKRKDYVRVVAWHGLFVFLVLLPFD